MTSGYKGTTAKHGTNSRYVNQSCRCSRCRKAHNEASKPLQAARVAALRALGREYPVRFRELYEAECARRGIELRPIGRPPG